MPDGFLRLGFSDDGDGTGTLDIDAEVDGFSGRSHAYFNKDDVKRFAEALLQYPLPEDKTCSITAGFGESRGRPSQEHVGIDAYPVNRRGVIRIQGRLGTPDLSETTPESQRNTQAQNFTTHEPVAQISQGDIAMRNTPPF